MRAALSTSGSALTLRSASPRRGQKDVVRPEVGRLPGADRGGQDARDVEAERPPESVQSPQGGAP